jgi:lipopolysaccharide transport system permease protein
MNLKMNDLSTLSTTSKSSSNTHIVIEPPHGWLPINIKEIWRFRELLYFLAWRDIKVRYRQTVLGAAWAIIQPFFTMVVFSVVFGQLANLPSDGIPYPIFSYTALLPWQLFAFALLTTSNSLINSQELIAKIYFPRLIVPLASVLVGVIDFAMAFVILLGMMIFYKITPTFRILYLPLLILLALLSAIAIGLWFSALSVRYRDLRNTLPFVSQLWMYATPIAYAGSLIPENWRLIYSLNPMTGVVEGFRWALLGQSSQLAGAMMWVSSGVVIILLVGGLFFFRRNEDYFADYI